MITTHDSNIVYHYAVYRLNQLLSDRNARVEIFLNKHRIKKGQRYGFFFLKKAAQDESLEKVKSRKKVFCKDDNNKLIKPSLYRRDEEVKLKNVIRICKKNSFINLTDDDYRLLYGNYHGH